MSSTEGTRFVSSGSHEALNIELNDGLRDRELDSLEELLTLIADTKREIAQLKLKGREKTAKEKEVTLGDLEKLQSLAEQVKSLKPVNIVEPGETAVPKSASNEKMPAHKNKKELYLETLREDLATMPSCAEKTTMELLLHYERELLGDPMGSQKETVSALLQKLHDQIKEQELFSNDIRISLQDVKAAVYGSNSESAVEALGELLKTFRPLHIQELKRLVEKTKEAAELIRGKEIILLIGGTAHVADNG
ncbi:unnamed protein product [Rotaria magnacalcarata]|nr:unnamed protein product [Rotaria magnacalcarata]CAF1589751.1 unnamed protein product [Rotaria magnacalcarata]CAF1945684.1 unnamed protein product [Rotaria magnacalcarata]CAF2101487.1 unnamed protein product [Rotaria magnacalcarata]CAF4222126.1 unnamed protein product [Rotaria magnacalcarata]